MTGMWFLESPKRLIASAVVVAGVLIGGGSALALTGGDSEPKAAPAPVVQADIPYTDGMASKAVQFVTLWSALKPGQTKDEWLAQLDPLCVPDLRAGLRFTDPVNLPGVPPYGKPSVPAWSGSQATVRVPLKGGSAVLVAVVDAAGTLLVSGVEPEGDL